MSESNSDQIAETPQTAKHSVCKLNRLPPKFSVQDLRLLLTDFEAERIFLNPRESSSLIRLKQQEGPTKLQKWVR